MIPYVEREIIVGTDEHGRESRRIIEHPQQLVFVPEQLIYDGKADVEQPFQVGDRQPVTISFMKIEQEVLDQVVPGVERARGDVLKSAEARNLRKCADFNGRGGIRLKAQGDAPAVGFGVRHSFCTLEYQRRLMMILCV